MKSPNKLALTLLCGVLAVNSAFSADNELAAAILQTQADAAVAVVEGMSALAQDGARMPVAQNEAQLTDAAIAAAGPIGASLLTSAKNAVATGAPKAARRLRTLAGHFVDSSKEYAGAARNSRAGKAVEDNVRKANRWVRAHPKTAGGVAAVATVAGLTYAGYKYLQGRNQASVQNEVGNDVSTGGNDDQAGPSTSYAQRAKNACATVYNAAYNTVAAGASVVKNTTSTVIGAAKAYPKTTAALTTGAVLATGGALAHRKGYTREDLKNLRNRAGDLVGTCWNLVPSREAIKNKAGDLAVAAWNRVPAQTRRVIAAEAAGAVVVAGGSVLAARALRNNVAEEPRDEELEQAMALSLEQDVQDEAAPLFTQEQIAQALRQAMATTQPQATTADSEALARYMQAEFDAEYAHDFSLQNETQPVVHTVVAEDLDADYAYALSLEDEAQPVAREDVSGDAEFAQRLAAQLQDEAQPVARVNVQNVQPINDDLSDAVIARYLQEALDAQYNQDNDFDYLPYAQEVF